MLSTYDSSWWCRTCGRPRRVVHSRNWYSRRGPAGTAWRYSFRLILRIASTILDWDLRPDALLFPFYLMCRTSRSVPFSSDSCAMPVSSECYAGTFHHLAEYTPPRTRQNCRHPHSSLSTGVRNIVTSERQTFRPGNPCMSLIVDTARRRTGRLNRDLVDGDDADIAVAASLGSVCSLMHRSRRNNFCCRDSARRCCCCCCCCALPPVHSSTVSSGGSLSDGKILVISDLQTSTEIIYSNEKNISQKWSFVSITSAHLVERQSKMFKSMCWFSIDLNPWQGVL